MSEDFSKDPHFQRLSREMASGATFDAVTVATIVQHGTVEQWAARLARFCGGGLLVLRTKGLKPNDQHVVYAFASKMYGRVEGGRALPVVDPNTEPIEGRVSEEHVRKLVHARQGKPFSLVEATNLIGSEELAITAIALVRRHAAFRIDEPPKKKGGDGEGRFAIDLDRLPKELGGRRERTLMDGPPDLTRVEALSRALAVEAFTALVEEFYGTSGFTLGRVKRLPWFIAHTGHNKGHDAFEVMELLVKFEWLIDLTDSLVHHKSDNRAFRFVANNRIADRVAMRSGKIWGEERCVGVVEEVAGDPALLEACSIALRSIAGDDEGWFVVNRDVAEIIRNTFDWSARTHHQQFVERFLVLLAATPVGSLLQIRTEISSDDGGIDVLYCRCASTRSSEESEDMADAKGAKGSQTSKADDLKDEQVAACVKVYPNLLQAFWGKDFFKVAEVEAKDWFRNGPLKAGVQAPAFCSLLIKQGFGEVTSPSYAEGSRERRIRLKKQDRRVIFLAMEHNAISGAKNADDLINQLRTDPNALDNLETLLIQFTEAAKPGHHFVFQSMHAVQIRKVLGGKIKDATDSFVEYFLRRLANEEGLLDLNEEIGAGEDQSFSSPVTSRFACAKRKEATQEEPPKEVDPPPPAEGEGGGDTSDDGQKGGDIDAEDDTDKSEVNAGADTQPPEDPDLPLVRARALVLRESVGFGPSEQMGQVPGDSSERDLLVALTVDQEGVSEGNGAVRETLDQELARLRAEYGMEEEELRRRAEAQQTRLARIEALELQMRRSRQIDSIIQAALGQIAQETSDATERVVLARTVGRRLLEHVETPTA